LHWGETSKTQVNIYKVNSRSGIKNDTYSDTVTSRIYPDFCNIFIWILLCFTETNIKLKYIVAEKDSVSYLGFEQNSNSIIELLLELNKNFTSSSSILYGYFSFFICWTCVWYFFQITNTSIPKINVIGNKTIHICILP
jgi:hypothetical protein